MTQEQPISLTNVAAGVLGGIGVMVVIWFMIAIVMEVAESDWWQERQRDTSCVGVGRYQHLPPVAGNAMVFDTCTGRYWRSSPARWEVYIDSIPPVCGISGSLDAFLNHLELR